jgi:hypothetical protein
MRITVHLDTFDCQDSAYAIIWLDRETGKWSREGHAVIDLPAWGTLAFARGSTHLRFPLCTHIPRRPEAH